MKKVNFKKWSFFSFQGCLVLFILLGSVKLEAQTIRYVRTSARGTGDGSSWANASGNLQAMINASAIGDTVWVGAGTYKPTQDLFGNSLPLDPRSLTFYIKDGVNLYGGFAGTETNLSQRNITINKTTLSGEIGNLDYYDNCFHVVVASAPSSGGIGVTIDGFTIKSGFCDGNGAVMVNGNSISYNSGAGVYIVNGTNKLSNNNVSSNESKFGGSTGIRIVNGTNTLTGNTVSGNGARLGSGGGIGLFNGTNMLINNTISNNSAYPGFGAGILASHCTNTFINNVVSGNNVQDGSGAGIRTSQCTNILIDNEFSYNNADYGAGFDSDGCINTLIGNTFFNNFSAFLGGAGMYLVGSTSTVVNNVLYDNTANKGAGIYTEGGNSTVINNTFWRNKANSGSGGIYTSGGINTLTNNIFWENTKGGSAYT
ncbi:MAG: right-handed parallel beta-helix repeat-containing protein, partial [Saprospiraceae bacterium]|nr:right-handed parallel beta-helix repeat-containing protein [Saprospiraceae bacterium]